MAFHPDVFTTIAPDMINSDPWMQSLLRSYYNKKAKEDNCLVEKNAVKDEGGNSLY